MKRVTILIKCKDISQMIRKVEDQNVISHSSADADVNDGDYAKISIFVSYIESVSEKKTQ